MQAHVKEGAGVDAPIGEWLDLELYEDYWSLPRCRREALHRRMLEDRAFARGALLRAMLDMGFADGFVSAYELIDGFSPDRLEWVEEAEPEEYIEQAFGPGRDEIADAYRWALAACRANS